MGLKEVINDKYEELINEVFEPVLRKTVDEMEFSVPENSLMTEEQKREATYKECMDFLHAGHLKNRILSGIAWLMGHYNEKNDQAAAETLMNSMQSGLQNLINYTEENPEASLLSEEVILQDCMKISDEEMNGYFEIATEYFQNQEFDKASDVFFLLTFLNGDFLEPWLLFGISEQQREEHHEAIKCFSQANALAPEEAFPFVCALDSYVALECYEEAQDVIHMALQKLDKAPPENEKALRDHLEQMQEYINKNNQK